MGAYDSNGIWIYTEDDPASPFSDLLNTGMESVSVELGNDRARLDAVEGRGDASNWTPDLGGVTLGNGAVSAFYARIGDLVAWQWKLVLGSTTSVTAAIASDLPTEVTGSTWMAVGNGFVSRGTSATGKTTLVCRMSNGTVFNLWYTGAGSLGVTSPLSGGTWLANDVISVGGTYFAP